MAFNKCFCIYFLLWRVEKDWEKFWDIAMEWTNDVCGMSHVGGQRREASKWWNEEVGVSGGWEELLWHGCREEIGLGC